ncbi:hypothetical protein PoB_007135700 [Plakobranchus ocellatus]|uniref:Uncharacterized protein n=1 Tax=Plakobranchus ocellatus TaxID=259542 RepID=A0AAV4DKN9_9GAST|nr:hypothetical protein PoB_007135700 [Plakobranchus ocellatus]
MQSSQSNRSLCSCIIGIGRTRTRPTYRQGARAFWYCCKKQYYPAVSSDTSAEPQYWNAFGFHRFCARTSALFRASSQDLVDQAVKSHCVNTRLFSTFRVPQTRPRLGPTAWQHIQKSTQHNTHSGSLNPCGPNSAGTYSPGIRLMGTSAARRKGGGGGGGGSGSGGSSGPINTHYQFMNPTRNIFGHSDG